MAVGDVVSGLTGAGVALTFTPAVGVECMISCASVWKAACSLSNGTNLAYFANGTDSASPLANQKLFINNTIYIGLEAGTSSCLYTGIQIK